MKNKQVVIGQIAEATGRSKKEVEEVIEGLVVIARRNLLADEVALVPGFGRLKLSRKPAREGRRPFDGQTVMLPAKNTARLAISKTFKDALQSTD